MKIEFLDEAQIELDEAVEYYNNEVDGLGDVFLQEVLNTIDRIAKFPDAWHLLSENTRRCQTRRFPYGLIYTKLDSLVVPTNNLIRCQCSEIGPRNVEISKKISQRVGREADRKRRINGLVCRR